MTFMIEYEISPDNRADAVERFLESGGAVPPAGVTMLARWHDAGMSRGWTICEADNAVDAGRWANQWADLITQDITPVVSDEELGQILTG